MWERSDGVQDYNNCREVLHLGKYKCKQKVERRKNVSKKLIYKVNFL